MTNFLSREGPTIENWIKLYEELVHAIFYFARAMVVYGFVSQPLFLMQALEAWFGLFSLF